MREVEIKKGTYGHRIGPGRVQPVARGGKVSVSDEEAARLVGIGVGIYADSPIVAAVPPSTPSVNPEVFPDATGAGMATPTGLGGESKYTAPDENEVAKLERMTKGDLEQMARDMGIDISGAKNNHERAVLIATADADDSVEESSALGVEGIVS